MMEAICCAVCFFGFYIGVATVWFVAPTLIVYVLMHRFIRKAWKMPCDLIDIPTLVVPCCIWYHFAQIDSMGRGLAWFVDILALGAVYGILFVIRAIVIWFRPQWRLKASLLMLVLTTVAMLTFALTGIWGKE